MPQSGKLLVIGFFLVGFILAGGAILYHFNKTRWAMGFWGTENARLIVRAPEVDLFRVSEQPDSSKSPTSEPETSGPVWQLDGETLQVVEQRPITDAPGLIHMRMALVEDANFDITAEPPADRTWDYVFRFKDAQNSLLIVVDSNRGLVRQLIPGSGEATPIANISPIADGMSNFLKVQFENEEAEKAASD